MVVITFEENLREYFIIGESYIMVDNSNRIVKCTGFKDYQNCHGYACGKNIKLGICDGMCRPTFDNYPNGCCAYRGCGTDRFIRIQNTNERW